jgi:hypothetical protein
LIDQEEDHDSQQTGVYGLVVPGQPVGDVDVKVITSGVGILSCPHGEGATIFVHQKHNSLHEKTAESQPHPMINAVGNYGIEQIEDHPIEEQPNDSMDDFDGDEFV